MASNDSLPPAVTMRLVKDIRAICSNPLEGIRLHFSEDNISNLLADIDGPVGTPFEGGVFRCKLVFGQDFPASPPKGYFLTKIFHPNVAVNGEICVNTLKRDWKSSLGIEHVLLVIRCLLIVPNATSALNEEAGKLLLEAYDEFAKRASLMTRIHATPKGCDSNKLLKDMSLSSSSSSCVRTVYTGTLSSHESSARSTGLSSPSSSSNSENNNTSNTDDALLLREKQESGFEGSLFKGSKAGVSCKVTTSTSVVGKSVISVVDRSKLEKKKSLRRL